MQGNPATRPYRRRTVTCSADGAMVNPKRSPTGGAAGSSAISKPCASVASAARASSSARLRPGQNRGPALKRVLTLFFIDPAIHF